MTDQDLDKLASSSRRAATVSIFGVVIVISSLVYSSFKLAAVEKAVHEKQQLVRQLDAEASAYRKEIKKLHPLLTEEDLTNLHDKGRVLIEVDKGEPDDDAAINAALLQTSEGVYFIWCRTGMNSNYSGASFGAWLRHSEALAWAGKYAAPDDFRKVFGDDALRLMDRNIEIGLCEK